MNALKMSHDRNAKPIKRISGYNSRGLFPKALKNCICYPLPQDYTQPKPVFEQIFY